MVLTETISPAAPRLCECGCGGQPKRADSRFLPGHHMYVYGQRWPTCRRCGRKASRPGKRLDSYDAATNTYLCKWCRRQQVRCRRCGKIVELVPSRIKNLSSLQRKTDGSLTYLCRECQAHDRVRVAKGAFLKQHYAIGPGDPAEGQAWKDHMKYVFKRAGGRGQVLAKRDAARTKGLTESGRRKLTIKRMVKAVRTGEFRLCPSCHKLVYLPQCRVRDGALGFHRPCYLKYMETEDYRDWRKKIGDLASPTLKLRLKRYPHPLPPKPPGRPPTAEQLEQRLQWLLRHYLLRESWAEIAAITDYERTTIGKGIASFIAVLPNSWSEVFGNHVTGRRLDDLLPIDRLRPSENV